MALVSGFSLVIVGEAMPVKNEGMLSLSYGEPLANVNIARFSQKLVLEIDPCFCSHTLTTISTQVAP